LTEHYEDQAVESITRYLQSRLGEHDADVIDTVDDLPLKKSDLWKLLGAYGRVVKDADQFYELRDKVHALSDEYPEGLVQ